MIPYFFTHHFKLANKSYKNKATNLKFVARIMTRIKQYQINFIWCKNYQIK